MSINTSVVSKYGSFLKVCFYLKQKKSKTRVYQIINQIKLFITAEK